MKTPNDDFRTIHGMESPKAQYFRFLAIGSGLAGLSYALQTSEHGSVAILTKAEVTDANTSYAQGGIAAAVGEADSWHLHERDTMIAGAELSDPDAVRFLVQRAPSAIEFLRKTGARFDLSEEGELELGREGGHSMNRIVKHSDTTGWEIERAVVEAVKSNPAIRVFEHAFVTSLIMKNGRCIGATAMVEDLGLVNFYADAVLLATGGCGRMYMHTTNPTVATADGIGLADGVGAKIENMEFMQFHPTTLYHPQMRSFLITEAVRGAGGTLRNHLGRRFMYDYDDRLELAPRDVVARAMQAEMTRVSTWCLYLDTTHLPQQFLKTEFPNIYSKLAGIKLEIHKDWIPVVPAQHYSCGGVSTDLAGRTSVPGLYAAGEVASTGVHGANRLASNSLLEALVFAQAAAEASTSEPEVGRPNAKPKIKVKSIPEAESIRIRKALQHLMTDKVGIERSNKGLAEAKRGIKELLKDYASQTEAPFSQHPLETYNLLIAAKYVVEGASKRKKNVGLHYNVDLVTASSRSKKPAPQEEPPLLPTPV